MAAFNVLPFGNNCAANKKKNAIKTSNQCQCDVCVWPLEGATVVMIPTQKYTHKDNSSYKIQFYCQNSAHKTLQNDCKKKKKYWLITVVLITGDSNHIKAQTLKECFLRKIQMDVYFTEELRNMSHRHFLF